MTWEPAKESYYELRPARAPKYKVEFQGAGQLSDVTGYKWFSPAAMYLWGQFTDLQLQDLMSRHNLVIYWHAFQNPVLAGFSFNGDKSWNHTLWAVAEDKWDPLVDSVLEAMMVDRDTKTVTGFALQYLTVVDPLFADKRVVLSADAPRTTIGYFAVLTDKYQLAFTRREYPLGQIPQVRTLPAATYKRRVAGSVYSGTRLTTDKVFERYKHELIREGEADFRQKWEKLKNDKRRG
jgi:hypothetical protein